MFAHSQKRDNDFSLVSFSPEDAIDVLVESIRQSLSSFSQHIHHSGLDESLKKFARLRVVCEHDLKVQFENGEVDFDQVLTSALELFKERCSKISTQIQGIKGFSKKKSQSRRFTEYLNSTRALGSTSANSLTVSSDRSSPPSKSVQRL